MLAMALMAFPLALLVGFTRSAAIADGSDPSAIAAPGHVGPAFMFVGFASVFAAISFAIAFGLATIVEVLRFQARRIWELPAGSPAGWRHGADPCDRATVADTVARSLYVSRFTD